MKKSILLLALICCFLSCKKDYLCTMYIKQTISPSLDGYPIETKNQFMVHNKEDYKKYNGMNEAIVKSYTIWYNSYTLENTYTLTTTTTCNCE